MNDAYRFVANCYRDSVSLMQFSKKLKTVEGVVEASVVMATKANLTLLRESGSLVEELSPRPDDLLLVVRTRNGIDPQPILAECERELRSKVGPSRSVSNGPANAVCLRTANLELRPHDWVLISVPGDYAAAEALKAMSLGLNVMIFSDNVSIEREIVLKRFAAERGVLCLGPDCGTSIVEGIPMGFANRVRRGGISVVGASGTGIQEITTLIHVAGAGIRQAYGVGGRDLKQDVGGSATLACIERIAADPETTVLVVVSKPPSPNVRAKIETRASQLSIPVVFCFVGEEPMPVRGNLVYASSLEHAAQWACWKSGVEPTSTPGRVLSPAEAIVKPGHFLRGLYSGGTLGAEAAFLLARAGLEVRANLKVPGVLALADQWTSAGHCVVDLGEDEFTRGKPHPMIDASGRLDRMIREAEDPLVSIVFFDVVLGYGANVDPASELVRTIESIRITRPDLRFFAVVVGTDDDVQSRRKQTLALERADVAVFPSNARLVEALLSTLSSTSPE